MSLRLHKKHGVNPTIPICFFCEQPKGDVVLLGASYKGKAPMHMLFDYDPCETCQDKFEQGILFIEVGEKPWTEGQIPLYKNGPYPSGRHWVLKRDAFSDMFPDSDTKTTIMQQGKALIDPDTAKEMGLYDVQPNAEESPSDSGAADDRSE